MLLELVDFRSGYLHSARRKGREKEEGETRFGSVSDYQAQEKGNRKQEVTKAVANMLEY